MPQWHAPRLERRHNILLDRYKYIECTSKENQWQSNKMKYKIITAYFSLLIRAWTYDRICTAIAASPGPFQVLRARIHEDHGVRLKFSADHFLDRSSVFTLGPWVVKSISHMALENHEKSNPNKFFRYLQPYDCFMFVMIMMMMIMMMILQDGRKLRSY